MKLAMKSNTQVIYLLKDSEANRKSKIGLPFSTEIPLVLKTINLGILCQKNPIVFHEHSMHSLSVRKRYWFNQKRWEVVDEKESNFSVQVSSSVLVNIWSVRCFPQFQKKGSQLLAPADGLPGSHCTWWEITNPPERLHISNSIQMA